MKIDYMSLSDRLGAGVVLRMQSVKVVCVEMFDDRIDTSAGQ